MMIPLVKQLTPKDPPNIVDFLFDSACVLMIVPLLIGTRIVLQIIGGDRPSPPKKVTPFPRPKNN